ncbi:hypothetical protein GYA13_01255 [Candidatus Kuenenbacteria bacterium]|nr:hypothetical protein [Candidatus Kuenenbacteria bacterium]
MTGNKAEGRLNEMPTKEEQRQAERLEHQINLESPLNNGQKILPVAADAVAIFDHSNLPRSVAYLDFKNLPEPYQISASDLKNAQQFIDDGGLSDPNAVPRALYYIDKKIIESNPENAGKTVGQRWSRVSQILSESEWNQYFEYYNKLKGQKGELERKRAELQTVAEQRNERLSNIFLEKFQKTAEELLHNNLGHLNEKLAQELQLFIKYQDRGDEDRAFSAANNFTTPLILFEEYGSMTDEQIKLEINKLLDVAKTEPAEREDAFKEILNKYETYQAFYLGLSEETRGLIKRLVDSKKELERQHQLSWQTAEEELKKIISSTEQGSGQIISAQEYLLLNKKISEKNSQLVLDCRDFLKRIEQIVSEHTLSVNFISYKNIESDNKLNPFGGTESDVSLLLQHIDHPALRRLIEKDLGISLLEMERLPQHHLARFLGKGDKKMFQRLRSILAENPEYKQDLLNSFVVVAEDVDYGEQLLALAEKLQSNPAEGSRVFGTYDKFVKESYGLVSSILTNLRGEFPDLEISEDLVLQALLSRGKDYFVELNSSIGKDRPTSQVVDEFVQELNGETPRERIIRSQFKAIASLLEKNNINLKEFESKQELILSNLMSPETKALTFRALARMGKLEPIPEIHWRVDRTSEEYNLRFGIDLNRFLLLRAEEFKDERKQILLEIGPGSGVSKKERANSGLTRFYQDFALSDKIYYPLSPIIEKIIDFNKLERELEISASPEERKIVADFLYKTLVIKSGETSNYKFQYDQGAQALLAQDINGLKQLLPQLSEHLRVADEVPSNISSRDDEGRVIYPNKIKLSDLSLNVQKIKNLLDKNLEAFLREDWQTIDYYQLIDAFPANVMIGDIREVERLQDKQIDVEIAARSTVYAKGDKYQDFLKTLFDKLSVGGTTIDDSIRDNDGWYYRIAEVLEAKRSWPELTNNFEFLVVLGPGFPGEDFSHDMVPLAMYITKDGSSRKNIEESLLPGYELVTLEELANNQHYLEGLDKTGLTYENTKKILTP